MKRGTRPKGKVKILLSPQFAYAIGLIASDGCLSPNGRHIVFVSEDTEQLINFMRALNITVAQRKNSNRVQFSDVLFYRFLLTTGLMPNKSKILAQLNIPTEYFFDFLRGSFDGDGSFYSYWDPRWKSSFMFYTTFVSASKAHIEWLRSILKKKLMVIGYVTFGGRGNGYYQLRYAKKESLKIIKKMYYTPAVACLGRKRLKIQRALGIIGIVL